MSVTNGHDDWPTAEANVVGALLLGAPFGEVARIVGPEHFTRPDAALIYRAVSALASAGNATDALTVAELLRQTDHLQAAGGLAALSELARTTISPKNAAAYARMVRERADCSRVKKLAQESDGAELLEAVQRLATARTALNAPPASTIALRHIADIVAERREPQWLRGLHKMLERDVLAVLAGSRSTFKSFIAHHWAMLTAVSGEPVVILSAEGAGLDRRTDAWMRTHAPAVDLRSLKLYAFERALKLNASATLDDLRQANDAMGCNPALTVVDTLSKFAPGLDENNNAEVALYLATVGNWLREHYRCTGLLVAHAGHGDARRPRGASSLMANPDAEYIVERPDPIGMTVTVTRERFKDSPSLAPLAYTAEVVDLGRLDSYGEPVTSLVMRDAAVPAAGKPELHGRAQRQLLAALRAQSSEDAGIWTLADIREIGRKAGLQRNTARSAAEALTFSSHLTATIGGWKLADES